MVVKAVKASGGAGCKLSHRFVVGVSDLLVKLTHRPAMLLEVKFAKYGPGIHDNHVVKLDVSHLQQNFLRDYRNAGMLTGVLSAVLVGQRLLLAVFNLDVMTRSSYTVQVSDHQTDGRKPEAIVEMLGDFNGR